MQGKWIWDLHLSWDGNGGLDRRLWCDARLCMRVCAVFVGFTGADVGIVVFGGVEFEGKDGVGKGGGARDWEV